MKIIRSAGVLLALLLFALNAGCSPEVGSEAWCEDLQEKPKKEWTAGEAADYAKHCIFR